MSLIMEIEIHVPMGNKTRRRRHNKNNEYMDIDRTTASMTSHTIERNDEISNSHDINNDNDILQSEESKCDDYDYNYSYVLYTHQSRVLWYGLIPLLYESSPHQSIRVIQYILRHHITHPTRNDNSNHNNGINHNNHNDESDPSICWTTLPANNPLVSSIPNRVDFSSETIQHQSVMVRSLRWHSNNNNNNNQNENDNQNENESSVQHPPQCHPRIKMILSLVPPHNTDLEYTFMRHLIRYEHICIRAQSISGYISTIGGGFFLCHHFRTAILLAQYQQYLAILLNDEILYYTCFVQMAYSYIYNGQFTMAQSILRHVLDETNQKIMKSKSTNTMMMTTTTTTNSKYEIVQNMCRSAQLFGRRMRHYAKSHSKTLLLTTTTTIPTKVMGTEEDMQRNSVQMDNNNSNNGHRKILMTKTIDNYQRIRIVPDQSKPYDFRIAFSSNTV